MESIKMQVYFDTHFPFQNDVLQRNKKVKKDHGNYLLEEIKASRNKSVPSIESEFKFNISFIQKNCFIHLGNN